MLVSWLLDQGVPVNTPNDSGAALITAAAQGHVEIVLLLKLRGGRVNASKQSGDPEDGDFNLAIVDQPWRTWLLRGVGYPLGINSAAAYGFIEDVEAKLDASPDVINGLPSASPLMLAAQRWASEHC